MAGPKWLPGGWLTRVLPPSFIRVSVLRMLGHFRLLRRCWQDWPIKKRTAAFIDAGVKAAGICGVDGSLIQGKVRDERTGYLGDVVKVNPQVIESLLDGGFIPVVSPVSLNSFGRKADDPLLLNINGDTVAGEIAAAMRAEQLVFLTDVDGIKDAAGNIMRDIKCEQIEALLSSGVAYGGMIPKL